MCLSLETVGNVERIGEVQGCSLEVSFQQGEVGIFVGVMQRTLAQWQEFGGDDFVYHVAFDSTHGLCFGYDDNVFVFDYTNQLSRNRHLVLRMWYLNEA